MNWPLLGMFIIDGARYAAISAKSGCHAEEDRARVTPRRSSLRLRHVDAALILRMIILRHVVGALLVGTLPLRPLLRRCCCHYYTTLRYAIGEER